MVPRQGNDPRQRIGVSFTDCAASLAAYRGKLVAGAGIAKRRTGYRQVMSLEWSSVPLTRQMVRGLNSLACAAYIRPAQNWMEDGGGVEPLTRRCHGFQDRCPPTQASPSRFTIAHDRRANAFRVCREGKPLHTPSSAGQAFSGSCASGDLPRTLTSIPRLRTAALCTVELGDRYFFLPAGKYLLIVTFWISPSSVTMPGAFSVDPSSACSNAR